MIMVMRKIRMNMVAVIPADSRVHGDESADILTKEGSGLIK